MKLSESKVWFIPKCCVAVFAGMVMAVFSAGIFADVFDTTTQSSSHDFSHMETGFPLTGAHLGTECAACHPGGMFKGTPRNCSGCHSKGKRIVATVMSANHVVTSDECDSCHTNTVTFAGARFNHNKLQPGSCVSCHNGIISIGKPSSHAGGLRVTESCERCHRTYAWAPATFNHSGIAPGTCSAQCHNGILATGRPASHTTALKSTATCDTCHRFAAWFPTFYNHSSVVPGTCSNCHNHISATGKPAGHLGAKATLACDSCHFTSAWSPASYNHAGVAAGTCATCHAVQRPTSHVSRGYTGSCDGCHLISGGWGFNHALQQGKHTCNSCHYRRDHHGSGSQPCDYCHSVNGWGG